jgi:hypothetical protein
MKSVPRNGTVVAAFFPRIPQTKLFSPSITISMKFCSPQGTSAGLLDATYDTVPSRIAMRTEKNTFSQWCRNCAKVYEPKRSYRRVTMLGTSGGPSGLAPTPSATVRISG